MKLKTRSIINFGSKKDVFILNIIFETIIKTLTIELALNYIDKFSNIVGEVSEGETVNYAASASATAPVYARICPCPPFGTILPLSAATAATIWG